MITPAYAEVLALATRLPPPDQQRLVAALAQPPSAPPLGVPGTTLLTLLDTLPLPDAQALDEWEQVIAQACEQVDPRDW